MLYRSYLQEAQRELFQYLLIIWLYAGMRFILVTFLDVPNDYILNSKVIHKKIACCDGNRAKQHLVRMKWIREYIRKNCVDVYITFEHYYGWNLCI